MANKRTKSSKSQAASKGWVWKLIISLVVPLAVGGIAALIAGNAMEVFGQFNQPLLAPPAWLFPVAWTILYILMGLACFFVWIHPTDRYVTAGEKSFFFTVYGVQLVFNFLWSIFFFNCGWHLFAFIWLIALWLMVLALVIWSGKNVRTSMWLLLPYILWITFAGYLNIMIAILN